MTARRQVSMVDTLSSPLAPVCITGSNSPRLYSRKSSAKLSVAFTFVSSRTLPMLIARVTGSMASSW